MLSQCRSAIALAVLVALTACGGEAPPPAPQQTTRTEAPAAPEPASTGEYQVVAVADGGAITGKVTVTGEVPKPEKVEINKDTATCGTEKVMEDIKVGPGGTLAHAVVWIDGIGQGKAWSDGQTATVDQKDCHYIPQVQALAAGGTLEVVNSDPILHNIHAYSGEDTLFNIAQPLKGQKTPKKIAQTGPVHLKCDVHSWMNAWVFVAPHPYFAITKDDGTFSIGDVPPGSYTVKVWHGRFGEKSATVQVGAKGTASADFALQGS